MLATASTIIGKRSAEIVTVPREELDAATVAPRHDAEAIVLDLMQPAGSRRRLDGWLGQARLNALG
jgi:hypothetical protein